MDIQVGDLVEFGSQKKRFLITSIDDDTGHLISGEYKLQANLCKRVERIE